MAPRLSGEPDDRLWRWLLVLGLTAFGVAAFYGRQRGIHWGGDDADYALLARALRSFRYDDLFLLGTPPHTRYPPVYPALLGLWGQLVGDRVSVLASLNVLFGVGTLAILAHLVAVRTSTRAAAFAVIAVAANPFMLEHAGRLLSESPMTFLGASAIWLADQRPGRWGVALAIVAGVACALTRTAGVAVLVALGAHWIWHRRFGAALALAAASALFLGAWFLWTTQETAPSDAAYAARFRAYRQPEVPLWRTVAASVIHKGIEVTGKQIPEVLALPLRPGLWDNILWGPLSVGAVGVGLWTLGRRFPLLGFTLVAYGLVLLIWPFLEARLLVPVLPVLILAAVVGAGRIAGAVRSSLAEPARLGVVVLLAVVGASQARGVLSCDRSVFSETVECARDEELGLGRAIAHVARHVPSDAVVMVLRGEVLHYYTGNPTVPLPSLAQVRGLPPDTLLALTRADYILAARAYIVRLTALSMLLDRTCERLAVEFSEPPHTLLLEIKPPGTDLAANACEAVRRDFPPDRS